ncbi:MAG: hypothetical protein QOG71_2664 [Pyrinomonadaceae bacterium]|nr:hypothetical protein [Pyrinomonadaceae bacterium]
MKVRNRLVAAWAFLFVVPISVSAQSAPDVSVSDARFTYNVNQGVDPLDSAPGKRASPSTIVTSSPVQQVSALFRNAGAKTIKSVSWEYVVFKDAGEREIVEVYAVNSERTILPGESVRLKKEGYHLKNSPHVTARVTRIKYADETEWRGARTKR